MNRSHFTEKLTSCPLCSSGDVTEHYTIDSYDITFTTTRCTTCGFIFMNPPLSAKAVDQLYGEDYYSGKADYSYWDERAMEKYAAYVWDARINFIKRHAPRGRFLDVGSSFGGLMRSAEGKGFIPYGIELSPYASDHARKEFPHTVHTGTLKDHPFMPVSFTAITMVELIEHLPDPTAAVRECYSLLQEKGMLLIQTANMDGQQAKDAGKEYHYFMPGHLSYFSARNLEKLLMDTGFKRVQIYYPVEFGLLPKLKKSQGTFKSLKDYRKWLTITWYHLKGMIHTRYWSLTSSMVVAAWK